MQCSSEASAEGPSAHCPHDAPPIAHHRCWQAFQLSCTDSELPITADKFYSHHMQPARPAGHPTLDAKKSSYKQVGKFIKHMHKQKAINVRRPPPHRATVAC